MSDPNHPYCDRCGKRIDPPPAKTDAPVFCSAECMSDWDPIGGRPINPKPLDQWRSTEPERPADE